MGTETFIHLENVSACQTNTEADAGKWGFLRLQLWTGAELQYLLDLAQSQQIMLAPDLYPITASIRQQNSH